MQNSIQIRKNISPLTRITNNMKASAKAVNLVYVNDAVPGITRIKKGTGFTYLYENNRITDKHILHRIRSLVIPPAWKNVWICHDEKGHLQATGIDSKNRKQYRYHPSWNALRNHAKFSNLLEFGKTLPQIRKQIAKDIAQKEICEKKVIALILRLMEKTYIRVGNDYYEKMNGSHGLTTLKDKHVQLEGPNITFYFKGKKGVNHNITLKNKRLAQMVKQCRDIPGKELFQYIAADGSRRKIDSGMVNNYIKEISGQQFTTKDFRTWAGSVNALNKLMENAKNGVECKGKNKINEIVDHVSNKLGNTRAVCKKYYIHPLVLELCEKDQVPALKKSFVKSGEKELSYEEKWLMDILKNNVKNHRVIVNNLLVRKKN